jgi:hypothetical protein
MKPVDRLFYWIVAVWFGAYDYLRYRTHPHTVWQSAVRRADGSMWVHVCECWCGCRCAVELRLGAALAVQLQPRRRPVDLPRSSGWLMPPPGGWPSELVVAEWPEHELGNGH